MKISSDVTNHWRRGLSLIELLMMVTLIGIFSTLGLAFLGGTHSYDEARDRRNAQTIATLTSGAVACGVAIVEADNVQGTIDRLVAGEVVPTGIFKGKTFRLAGLSHDDIAAAARYLRVDGNALVYCFGGS